MDLAQLSLVGGIQWLFSAEAWAATTKEGGREGRAAITAER